MNPHTISRLTMVLALIAAVLAFAAAYVRYSKTGEVAVTPIAGGLFMLALGLGAYTRLKKADPDP